MCVISTLQLSSVLPSTNQKATEKQSKWPHSCHRKDDCVLQIIWSGGCLLGLKSADYDFFQVRHQEFSICFCLIWQNREKYVTLKLSAVFNFRECIPKLPIKYKWDVVKRQALFASLPPSGQWGVHFRDAQWPRNTEPSPYSCEVKGLYSR